MRELAQLAVVLAAVCYLFSHTPTKEPPAGPAVDIAALTLVPEPEPSPVEVSAGKEEIETPVPVEVVTLVFPAREALPQERTLSALEEADALLWFVYERTPKADPKDFAWKDPFVAKKIGMSLKEFVIGGMQERYRLKLASMILAMWHDGLDVGLSSCFRNDERQKMVEARRKNPPADTYHGGSARGGYGNGRACDMVYIRPTWEERIKRNPRIWAWVDKHGREFGLGRPFPKGDPMHVTPFESPEYANAHGISVRTATKKVSKPKKRHVQVASAKH